jgi:hypothetical protein
MTYDPTIPRVTDSPTISAPEILIDFTQYAAIFSRTVAGVIYNHVAFNEQHQGKHAAVLMENQTIDPGVTQDLTVLYNKNAISKASTEPQLFAQIPVFLPTENDTTMAANAGMQITYNKVNTAGPVYQSFLIGGYLIYFGSSLSSATVTLTPTPTKILMVQVQSSSTSVFVNVTQPDKFSFTTLAPSTVTWVAIAKA